MRLVGQKVLAVAKEVTAAPVVREKVARNIVMEYDRKAADVLRLVRAFVKQMDRHRAQMMNGGTEDTTYLSEMIDAEAGMNEVMRKLG